MVGVVKHNPPSVPLAKTWIVTPGQDGSTPNAPLHGHDPELPFMENSITSVTAGTAEEACMSNWRWCGYDTALV